MAENIVEDLSKKAITLLNLTQEWRAKREKITAFEGKASHIYRVRLRALLTLC